MGSKGPIPERKAELLGHRSKEELAGDTVSRVRIATKVTVPRADSAWNKIAKRIYDSAKVSGQATWYEPSDWALLYFVCDEISYYLDSGRSAMKLTAINQMLTTLLLTEGDRRRVNMEIDRGPVEDTAAQAARSFYENMLGTTP